MKSFRFKLTRKAAVLIPPSLPTPKDFLYLSNLDDQAGLRCYMRALLFYRSNSSKKCDKDPARIIREGLAKVLVHYYPFAGRLRDAPAGKLIVDCTGEGVLFVEADADVDLEQFGEMRSPIACTDQLLHDDLVSENVTNSPLMLIQVTRLRCGGFVFAMLYNHTMSDARGIVQFSSALSEMAKGATRPSVLPVWKREILRPRTNPEVKFPFYAYDEIEDEDVQMVIPTQDLTCASFFFGPKEIESLKTQARGECTTFEVLSACIWRSRTKVFQVPAEQEVRLIFPLDARTIFDPPLPEGFYGNAIASACVKTTAGELANTSLYFTVKLIKEAKMTVNDEYMRSLIDFMELKGRPYFTMFGSLVASQNSNMAVGNIDFGWGKAVDVRGGRRRLVPVDGTFCRFFAYQNTDGSEGIMVSIDFPSEFIGRFENEISRSVALQSNL